MTALRSSRAGRLALAALGLLLVQGWALALPLLHAAHEAGENGEQRHATAAAVVAGCPLDCHDPGHEHRGHDPATCASCHAGRALGSLARVARLDAGQRLATRFEAPPAATLLLTDAAPPRLRGPPSDSFLT